MDNIQRFERGMAQWSDVASFLADFNPEWKVCALIAGREPVSEVYAQMARQEKSASTSNRTLASTTPGMEYTVVQHFREQPSGGILLLNLYSFASGVDLSFCDVGVLAFSKAAREKLGSNMELQAASRFDRMGSRVHTIYTVTVEG